MNAVDTNVLVRYLVDDDAEQAGRARALVKAGGLYVSRTVLLETAWVLGSYYRFPARDIVSALRRLARLRQLLVQDLPQVERALDWAEGGMDIADAFHLAGAQDCAAFLTFDRHLLRAAGKMQVPVEVREPWVP